MFSVTLARKPLVNALQALKRIAPTRLGQIKPILAHALLRIDPDARRVTLTATDLERTLSVALQADDVARDPTARQIHADASPTAGPNAWTLPIADALQALKSTPDASVTLAPGELRHACGSIDVATYPDEDFPPTARDPVRTARPAVTYPTPALVRALERVTPFCQKDATRYALNAVNLQATPDAFVAVATDGRRLIVHAHNADPLAPVDPQRCVVMAIPLDACKVLPALLKGSASVTLQALEHEPMPAASARTQTDGAPDSSDDAAPPAEPQVATWVRLHFGASVLDVKTVEGKFPPYHEVCPKFDADAPPVTLQASDAAALVPLVRAGSSVIPDGMHAGSGHGTRIDAMLPVDVRPARPGRDARPPLRLHARYEGRTSAATLPVTVSGRSGHIGINAEFLADALDAIGPTAVTIRWNAANRPIRFDSAAGDCVVVVMPMNINDKALDVRNARYLYRAKLRYALQATPAPANVRDPAPRDNPHASPVTPVLLTRAERVALLPLTLAAHRDALAELTTPLAILRARGLFSKPTAARVDAPTAPTPAGVTPDAPTPSDAPHVVHAFDPALCVRIAADDVASLRRVDVARVLSACPPERLDEVAHYIVANRPHLRVAVYTARADVLAERLDAVERDALQATTPAPVDVTPDPVTPARDPAPRQIQPTPDAPDALQATTTPAPARLAPLDYITGNARMARYGRAVVRMLDAIPGVKRDDSRAPTIPHARRRRGDAYPPLAEFGGWEWTGTTPTGGDISITLYTKDVAGEGWCENASRRSYWLFSRSERLGKCNAYAPNDADPVDAANNVVSQVCGIHGLPFPQDVVDTLRPGSPDALHATPAPVDVKPIAPTRPTRAPVATPAGVTFTPDALDAAALARYAPLVDALQHVPALVPLLECLQAHARAQSRPLGDFPELSDRSPYRRADPLASMLVELFYRLGWTAGQAKRKHLPPTGDVSTLKRELMHALQARAVAVAA